VTAAVCLDLASQMAEEVEPRLGYGSLRRDRELTAKCEPPPAPMLGPELAPPTPQRSSEA